MTSPLALLFHAYPKNEWPDARLSEVVDYLLAFKGLEIPADWKWLVAQTVA